jgi:hypothetical protein
MNNGYVWVRDNFPFKQFFNLRAKKHISINKFEYIGHCTIAVSYKIELALVKYESMWVSLRRGRDCAQAKKAPRVMISIKFLFLLDSQVNFTRACQFWSQLINQKK